MLPKLTIRRRGWLAFFVVLCATVGAGDSKPSSSSADQEAFAEPYRTIQVATGDTGIIREVLVREGDAVEVKQPLVKLDDELVRATLEIARQAATAKGPLQSAEAELRLHASRAEKLEWLLSTGNARQEEFERAFMDKAIAAARVLAAQETLNIRALEMDRTQLELERRVVRTPIKGAVTKIHREVGEFVAPTDPVVVTVVQLDPLLATFSLRPTQAQTLRVGRSVQVQFSGTASPVNAEVEFVSAVTDARSGTVRVKVRIPNADGLCRSGERCTLLLSGRSTAATAAAVDEPSARKPAVATEPGQRIR